MKKRNLLRCNSSVGQVVHLYLSLFPSKTYPIRSQQQFWPDWIGPVGDTRAPGVPLRITENSQGCRVDDSFFYLDACIRIAHVFVFLFLQLHMILYMY